MIDEPEDDLDYGSDYEEDDLFASGDDEEDEIEKLIKQTTKKEQEVEGDYSKMSKRELQELIDAALDAGDFETLKKIQPFMKESLEWRIYESEIKKILK